MPIPTEPIGSIPRPSELIAAMADPATTASHLEALFDRALKDTIERFEATGSPVISDGEQTKPSFATYPVHGMPGLGSDGVVIEFADGHSRQLPRLTAGPFRYQRYAGDYVKAAKRYASRPVKQAVISASALSLLYPQQAISTYSQEQFLADLINEAEKDIRSCFEAGACTVQIDFTEGRLAVKLDPSLNLLKQFVALNNQVLARFTEEERTRIGVHTCPGGDQDSTHSADVGYDRLLPELFKLKVASFYLQMASERDPDDVLEIVKSHAGPSQRIFIGVTDPLSSRVETPDEIKMRIIGAATVLPPWQIGTTDDCGFSPFADDGSTAREIAFAKIAARVEGTRAASQALGL